MSDKPWTPGRTIWWLMIIGVVGIILSSLIGNGDLFVISMMPLSLGVILFAIKKMFN